MIDSVKIKLIFVISLVSLFSLTWNLVDLSMLSIFKINNAAIFPRKGNNVNFTIKGIEFYRGYYGFGNFMEKWFFDLSYQCINDKIVNFTYHPTKDYSDFIEFIPTNTSIILDICNQFRSNIMQNMEWKYFFNLSMDAYKSSDEKFKLCPSCTQSMVVYNNDAFIDTIYGYFEDSFNNYYNKYNNSNENINILDCDIGVHIRLGDLLGTPNKFKGIYTAPFFIDAVHEILKYNKKCINEYKKNIYIVTQISKESIRSSKHFNWFHELSNKIIYIIKDELYSNFSNIGYNITIISTNTIDDWNFLRNCKNVVCTVSSYCHTALLVSKYGSTTNVVFDAFLEKNEIKTIINYYKIFPSNMHLIDFKHEYGMRCQELNQLKWSQKEFETEMLNWIKTGIK